MRRTSNPCAEVPLWVKPGSLARQAGRQLPRVPLARRGRAHHRPPPEGGQGRPHQGGRMV